MLVDNFKREHDYLRVSVTDRCNLRCTYCIPNETFESLNHNEILRNEEFVELISIFVSMGVKKIRFTGGEPLVRKGFTDILRHTKDIDPELKLAVTTNGVILGNYLDEFRDIGIEKINISLDTLSKERFARLTRRDFLPDVLANIEKALNYAAFEIKLNVVLLKGTLNEIDAFINYCLKRDIVLRFIERMPFQAENDGDAFISSDILLDELAKRGELIRVKSKDTAVALYYDLLIPNKGTVHIGVIPTMSHKFCTACNRLRITANGLFKTCLLSSNEYNIKTVMRSGAARDELQNIITNALAQKGAEHLLDYKHITPVNRMMSRIGG
ncbi:MAG: GTP 3',8-cyclase MoaA [Leptospirales bacterium]|nr:GTP 3',8-cyclase MoaA [Leptospirales bacterium]